MDSDDSDVNNTLYLTFKDAHPCWLFVGNSFLKFFYVFPCIFFNFAVLWVTIKSKTLRSTANYLLALDSIFELFHQSGHMLSIYTAFSGLNFVDFPWAVQICTPGLFGLFAVGPALFFTGVDRLFAVSFLSFYQRVNPTIWVPTVAAACSAYAGFILWLTYKSFDQFDGLKVAANIGDLIQGDASEFYYKYSLILNTVTIGIYVLVGIVIRYRTVDQSNRRIYRSLLAIVLSSVGGYYLMRIYTSFVIPYVPWDPITVWIGRQVFVIPLNISAGSSAPILYFTSVEYRNAFEAEFAGMFAFFRNLRTKSNNKVQPFSNNTQAMKQSTFSVQPKTH